jgi:two-component system, OmpR family, sensor kinase
VRTPSLRVRVVLAVLGVMTVAMVGLGLLVNAVLGARLHADLRDRLTERAGFAQLLAGRGYTDQDLADRLTGQGITAVVQDGGSAVYGRNFPPPGAGRPGPRPPRPAVDTSAVRVGTTAGGVLTATLPLTRGTLTLSADGGEIGHTLAQLRTVEWLAGAGILVVSGLLLTRVVSGALAPLSRMGAVAGRIAAGSRGERLRPTRPGTDLGRTAVALDGMLDALEASELRMRGFLADASHDLRTPVAGVIAAADSLLRDDPDRAERERRLLAMVREARRAGRLVDDLLLMVRLDGSDGSDPQRELRRQPVDLAVLAEEVAAAQRLLGADVRARVDGPAPVEGDPEQLTRVLTNLADNARREADHVLLDVRRRDGQVTVEVTDDGPGVPPAERDRVFERFVRLEAGPGRNGLGLPIARAVARAHRGDLTCENAPAGARFVLRIPAEQRVPAGNITR